jgi:hypothetical protein
VRLEGRGMRRESVVVATFVVFASIASLAVHGQVPEPSATPNVSPSPSTSPSISPSAGPSASPSGNPSPSPTPSPTPPPIVVEPEAGSVPVGSTQVLHVQSVMGTITATVHDPSLLDAAVDQASLTVTLSGKEPGATVVTIQDQRGLTKDIPVRIAYNAGTIAQYAELQITGDPASADYARMQAVHLAQKVAQARPGAQIIATEDQVSYSSSLGQDNTVDILVPVLIQGENMFSVNGTTRVHVENIAAPRIAPDILMVSDFPEQLTENGLLFTADLQRGSPSRFLYYHYNPGGQPERRIILRAENTSPEPAIVQFISGPGGPGANELQVGHDSTKTFLSRLVQNEGRLIVIPGNATLNIYEHDLPPGDIACNLLQLQVLNGGTVHLTLFAQDATSDPNMPLTSTDLLVGTHLHARGIYNVPEFHYMTQWKTTDPYLQLPIGQIPLPNHLVGQALAGDYGVLQSFVVNVQNPMSTPQNIAIYENPRGGRATGTYIIDGVMIQSHQVPAFSNYKLRQYVVPAKGFLRVTIITMPESGSSYPLNIIFAPDDGSVPPGAPNSPVY